MLGGSGGILPGKFADQKTKEEEELKVLPKDLQLQDDTLLEHVAYSELQATPTPRLTTLEQAVILGQW